MLFLGSAPLRGLLLATTTALAGAGAAGSLAGLGGTALPVPAGTQAVASVAPTPRPLAAAPARADLAPLLDRQRAAGLRCTPTSSNLPLCVHGDDAPPPARAAGPAGAASDGSATTSQDSGTIGCYGDGQDGPRVRLVYAWPRGQSERYAAMLPSFRRWASAMTGQVDDSAQQTGGRRHVRFATTAPPSCAVTVDSVALPQDAFTTFQKTVDALGNAGFRTPNSKYLVWAEASDFCGLAMTYDDDSPGLDNLNNAGYTGYARIDRRCWGQVETHELVHLLGGVQRSAPHATAGYHCNDGADVMCYDDGTASSTQRSVCPASQAQLLDCRSDDYFSTSAPRGSYLQTHWNTARSSFLASAGQDPEPASPSPASPAPPAATPRPVPALPDLRPLLSAVPVQPRLPALTASPEPTPAGALLGLPAARR